MPESELRSAFSALSPGNRQQDFESGAFDQLNHLSMLRIFYHGSWQLSTASLFYAVCCFARASSIGCRFLRKNRLLCRLGCQGKSGGFLAIRRSENKIRPWQRPFSHGVSAPEKRDTCLRAPSSSRAWAVNPTCGRRFHAGRVITLVFASSGCSAWPRWQNRPQPL